MNKLIVITPVYRNKKGLFKTLESLRNEDLKFDVLVIDDSPQPELDSVDFSHYPFEVHLIINHENIGITKSLNKGLQWITEKDQYQYIARLDAGDEVINNRLTRQMEYMDENIDCVLLGAAIQYVTTEGKPLYKFRPPVEDKKLRAKLHLNNYVPDAVVMMRLNAVIDAGCYRDAYPIAEGYDMSWRLAKIGDVANLPDVLLNYEVSPRQTSLKKRRLQLKSRLFIQIQNFDWVCMESYWGILKTGLAFILPWNFIIYMKSAIGVSGILDCKKRKQGNDAAS